jgi:hypothetical protein
LNISITFGFHTTIDSKPWRNQLICSLWLLIDQILKPRAPWEPNGEETPGTVVHVSARHNWRCLGHCLGYKWLVATGAFQLARLIDAIVLVNVGAGPAERPEWR